MLDGPEKVSCTVVDGILRVGHPRSKRVGVRVVEHRHELEVAG